MPSFDSSSIAPAARPELAPQPITNFCSRRKGIVYKVVGVRCLRSSGEVACRLLCHPAPMYYRSDALKYSNMFFFRRWLTVPGKLASHGLQ